MTHSNRLQINLRVAESVVDDLDALAENEHLTRIDVARQILLDGIADRKRCLALRLYESGKVSKACAAEIAGVTLWEWHDILDETHSREGLSAADLVTEVRRIVAEAAR